MNSNEKERIYKMTNSRPALLSSFFLNDNVKKTTATANNVYSPVPKATPSDTIEGKSSGPNETETRLSKTQLPAILPSIS